MAKMNETKGGGRRAAGPGPVHSGTFVRYPEKAHCFANWCRPNAGVQVNFG